MSELQIAKTRFRTFIDRDVNNGHGANVLVSTGMGFPRSHHGSAQLTDINISSFGLLGL
jgi:hypothetical protein